MYETFYSLSADPFRLSPDIRFCFGHSGHNEARAYLSYALKLGEGFILITGRPGTGKTTLIQAFLKELELSQVVAESIAASNLKAAELLRAVAYAFNIEVEGLDKATLRRRIQQFFAQQVRSGKRTLLIIDEAQGLSHAALEELRLLADLQTGSRPLLQLFLVGQEKLRDLMRASCMEQFQQRVIGTFHLKPLDAAETRAYVEHRLRQAGWKGDPELSGAALLGIYRYSKGVPRHINKICTRLFLLGYMEGKHRLDADDVVAISAELHEEQLAPLDTDRVEMPEIGGTEAVPQSPQGSLSLDDLAVRYHGPQADRSDTVSAAKVTGVATQQQAPLQPRPAASSRSAAAPQVAPFMGPNRQPRRGPESVGFKAAARQLVIETVRILAGGFNRIEKKGVSLGTLALIALPVVVLSAFWEPGGPERGYLFVEHSQPATAGSSVPADGEIVHAANLEPERNEPPAQDISPAPITTSVATQEAQRGVRVSADHATVVSSGVTPHQAPAGGVSGIPTSHPSLSVHVESDSATIDPPVVSSLPEEDTAPGAPSRGDSGAAVKPRFAAVEAAQPVSWDPEGMHAEVPATEPKPANEDAKTRVAAAAPAAAPPVTPVPVSQVTDASPAAAASATPSPSSRERQITELLSLARRALESDRLMIPAQNNAYHYYQRVLALQPGNSAALAGMDKIVARYAVLAQQALDRQDLDKATRYIARGLRVQPGEGGLLALQERIDRINSALLTASAEPEPPPPVVVPESKEKPKGFLLRMKEFFTRRSDGAQE